jgi:hypothetical protein
LQRRQHRLVVLVLVLHDETDHERAGQQRTVGIELQSIA